MKRHADCVDFLLEESDIDELQTPVSQQEGTDKRKLVNTPGALLLRRLRLAGSMHGNPQERPAIFSPTGPLMSRTM